MELMQKLANEMKPKGYEPWELCELHGDLLLLAAATGLKGWALLKDGELLYSAEPCTAWCMEGPCEQLAEAYELACKWLPDEPEPKMPKSLAWLMHAELED